MMPALARDQGLALLLGETSSGGACAVNAYMNLWGDALCYSGMWSIYTRSVSGELESVEEGIEPDLRIPSSDW